MSLALLRLPLIFGEILVRYSSQGARLSRSRFSFHTSLPPPRARVVRMPAPRHGASLARGQGSLLWTGGVQGCKLGLREIL